MLQKVLLLFCLVHAVQCVVFISSGKLDYLDAVKYCDERNSTLAKYNEAVAARNECRLHHTNVWYVRPETYPTHNKKEGHCYVHGMYWIPCRNKAWFFCDDGSERQIECGPRNGSIGDSEDKYKPVFEARTEQDLGPKISLNMYEWLLVAGSGLVCVVFTFAVTYAVLKCKFAKDIKLEQQYIKMKPTRSGRVFSAIDSKWYEETKRQSNGKLKRVSKRQNEKLSKLPENSLLFEESGRQVTSDTTKICDELPHIYERADKVKLKAHTLPVPGLDSPFRKANDSANTLFHLDGLSPVPPTYEEVDGRNYKRSLSAPSPHYETTRNTTFLEHQYTESTIKQTETDVKQLAADSCTDGYEGTCRSSPENNPYDITTNASVDLNSCGNTIQPFVLIDSHENTPSQVQGRYEGLCRPSPVANHYDEPRPSVIVTGLYDDCQVANGYETTCQVSKEPPKPYETIYKQWEAEEKRLTLDH